MLLKKSLSSLTWSLDSFDVATPVEGGIITKQKRKTTASPLHATIYSYYMIVLIDWNLTQRVSFPEEILQIEIVPVPVVSKLV